LNLSKVQQINRIIILIKVKTNFEKRKNGVKKH